MKWKRVEGSRSPKYEKDNFTHAKSKRANATVSKLLFILLGLSGLIRGGFDLASATSTFWSTTIALLLVVSGIMMLMLGFILFNPKNKFSPKIEIDENNISIREDVYLRTKKINWDELKQIQFKSFALDFLFNNGKSLLVVLRTTNEGSMEVKKSLMEIASKKSIQIVAG